MRGSNTPKPDARGDYTRNALGEITAADTTYDTTSITVASCVTYEPFGPLNGLTFGNSLTLDRDFDTGYQLTDQTTGLSQSFTQDELHRIDSDSGRKNELKADLRRIGYQLGGAHLTRDARSATFNAPSPTLRELGYGSISARTRANELSHLRAALVQIDKQGPARNSSYSDRVWHSRCRYSSASQTPKRALRVRIPHRPLSATRYSLGWRFDAGRTI